MCHLCNELRLAGEIRTSFSSSDLCSFRPHVGRSGASWQLAILRIADTLGQALKWQQHALSVAIRRATADYLLKSYPAAMK